MSESLEFVDRALAHQMPQEATTTRRRFVLGTAATLGSLGVLGLKGSAVARKGGNNTQTILNVAASAEVLATIVNTVGWERKLGGDAVTQRNVAAAAREELIHFNRLKGLGGKPASLRVWVPDAVFKNRTSFLSTLEVGDQIFVNAYLIATKFFGNQGNGALALTAAEFMGVEGVHRALARQSLGKLGNDRVFMKFSQKEGAPDAPNRGEPGFVDITTAVKRLRAAGFNFGAQGAKPGRFYNFDTVRRRTPNDPDLNTFFPVTR